MTKEAFKGEHYLKVDAKGRVMLPSPFRDVFTDHDQPAEGAGFRILLVYGGENREFVEGYTQAGAHALTQRIKQLPMGSQKYNLANAIFAEQSVDAYTDKDGRFSPPEQVRKKLGLPKDEVMVVFVGSTDKFRLWRADVYDAKHKPELKAQEESVLAGADPLLLFEETA